MENFTNVVDGDTAAAIVLVVASLPQRIRVPPSLLQSFQLALIQQFQNAAKLNFKGRIICIFVLVTYASLN